MIEYVIDPVKQTCAKYGSDKLYAWTYGSMGMNYNPYFDVCYILLLFLKSVFQKFSLFLFLISN